MRKYLVLVLAVLLAVAVVYGQNPHPPSAVHVAAALVPTVGTYGPTAAITCPAGAVNVARGDNLQTLVTANAVNTAFCLWAGVHPLTSGITPKSGNTFVGEYGAILDGTGWATSVQEEGAFRAHNQDINDVTIRNLVIRNMPQRGIHAYSSGSCGSTTCAFSTAGADRWTIENNEIASNATGIVPPNYGVIRNNYIHHNVGPDPSGPTNLRGGGVNVYLSQHVLFENNDVSYNGSEMKWASLSPDTIVRNNFVHHNLSNGIWYDGENTGSIIEGNRVEDNAGIGIFYEVSGQGVIRNNTLRRNGDNGIMISGSHNVELSGNVLEDNLHGIFYFVDCSRMGSAEGNFIGQPFSMANLSTHDNAIRVSTAGGALASGLSYTSCGGPALAVYTSNPAGLAFSHNTYTAPDTTSAWFYWGGISKTFPQWQAIPQDASGSIAVR